jgi:hypothetical protein
MSVEPGNVPLYAVSSVALIDVFEAVGASLTGLDRKSVV